MEYAYCDDRGEAGFSWVAAEPQTRASHALTDDGRVWLVDALDWPEAIERACALGRPEAVVQLLDRHNRDCAAIARRLAVPHLVVPARLDGTPFEILPLVGRRWWRERALWWPARKTLVVADAIGSNPFFTGGRAALGVHLFLRLTPPRRRLGGLEPEHVLVGHGAGVHGPAAADGLRQALRRSRLDLPRVVARLPSLGLAARRQQRERARKA